MNRGFSLLEAIIALALASLVIYGASGIFLGRSEGYQLKKSAWEIQTRLNYARYKAIFENRPVRVRFRPNGYTVEKFDSSLNVWLPEAGGSCEGVNIEANNTPTFHPVGTVSNLATIIVSNAAGACRITLAISGRIRVVML
ncbi:MAG: GspH/FimT family pseudopilin [Candidatus Aminicenantes bacterium]|nr:GspH/FimT family pseudopilin [Candidatus Aminicenantes bacterium]